MKKLFLGLILTSSLIACKKETKLPSTNISGTKTDTTNVVDQPTSGYGPNITDIDGNTYKTVFIGTQQWMAENLKVSKYNDGTKILNITDDIEWSNLNQASWVYYNNDLSQNKKYGKLYNWYVLNLSTNGNKNLCPTGWHIPSENEWTVLTEYLGGENIAGGKMKEVGTINWSDPNTDATNISLFNGLPGGFRFSSGYYTYIHYIGSWWSSTENDIDNAWKINLVRNNSLANIKLEHKNSGLSVRCIKD